MKNTYLSQKKQNAATVLNITAYFFLLKICILIIVSI